MSTRQRPKRRRNARTEGAGIEAVRKLFRSQGWIYQEVSQENDYGKDAYVDLPEGEEVTGITFALQVKSGLSFKRKSGYRIPVECHRITWMESSLPVFGVVYDPETQELYWQNITQYLRDRVGTNVRQIVVPATQILDETTIEEIFRQEVYRAWDVTQSTVFLLNLFGSDEQLQRASALDLRTVGVLEPRLIILLRASLRDLVGDGLRTALWILGHFVPSRRLWLDHMKWAPAARQLLRERMFLDPVEIVHIISSMEDEDWQQEQSINEMLWLVLDDPEGLLKLRQALELALLRDLGSCACQILEIICFLAGPAGPKRFDEVVADYPSLKKLKEARSLRRHLKKHPQIYLFSFAMDATLRGAGRLSRDWSSTRL